MIDVNAGLLIKAHDVFSIKPFLSYSYMNFSWTAKGGSFLYPDGHAYSITGMNVGTYAQTWNIISLGISLNGVFNRFFNVDLSLKFSPVIWLSARDNHIMRDLIVTENLFGGFFIEPRMLFSFTPNDFFTLSLSMTYKEVFGTRGDSTYNDKGIIDTYKNLGGAGYFSSEFGIVASFAIIRSRASGGGGGTSR
jgi:outer membrane protease